MTGCATLHYNLQLYLTLYLVLIVSGHDCTLLLVGFFSSQCHFLFVYNVMYMYNVHCRQLNFIDA